MFIQFGILDYHKIEAITEMVIEEHLILPEIFRILQVISSNDRSLR